MLGFALLHGYVHALEATPSLTYAGGLATATLLVQALGFGLGILSRYRPRLRLGFAVLCAGVGIGLAAGF